MTTTAPARPTAPRGGSDRCGAVEESADLALLTGPDARDLIGGALVGPADPLPDGLRVDVVAVHHRPGLGVSVCYDVSYDGVSVPEAIIASTASPRPGEQTDRVAVLDDGVRTVRVWRRADDPALSGLRDALTPAIVAGWIGREDPPEIGVLTYRPTRRAVAVARWHDATVYLKVVRPSRSDQLLRRHRALAASPFPAPAVLAAPEPGVVVLAEADGESLAHALASGDRTRVPSPSAVVAALDALPARALELTRRPSWVDRLEFHAAAAQIALPARAAEVDETARRVRAVLARSEEPPVVATHGDLNVANLFVRDGRPSAFIDVDSLGPGYRDDDLATVLAHLAVLPSLAPEQYTVVADVLGEWTDAFARTTDAAALLARTSAVLVSLVAGDAAQAQVRLDLAIETIDRAEQGRWP